MNVYEAKVGNGDINHVEHFLTHTIGNLAICLCGWGASSRVQIVNQVAKDDTQKRERESCRDREEDATNYEENIGLGIVEREEEADIGERFAKASFGEHAVVRVPGLYPTSAYLIFCVIFFWKNNH